MTHSAICSLEVSRVFYDSKVQIFQRLELNESSFPNFQRKFAYASVPPYLIAFSYLNVCLNLVISLVEITSYLVTPPEEKNKKVQKRGVALLLYSFCHLVSENSAGNYEST